MSSRALRFLSLLIIVTSPVAFAADVYKWRDASGRLQYGDKPPQGVKAEKVTAEITTVPATKAVSLPRVNQPQNQPPATPAPEPIKIDGATRQKLMEACEAAGGTDCTATVNEALNAAVKQEVERSSRE